MTWPGSRAVLDAGTARRLRVDAIRLRVVAATLVPSLGVGYRGLKNAVRDARVLNEGSCRMDRPSAHIPTPISQEVKAICVSRRP